MITVKNVSQRAVFIGSVGYPIQPNGIVDVSADDAGVKKQLAEGNLVRYTRPVYQPPPAEPTTGEVAERVQAAEQAARDALALVQQAQAQLADERQARTEADGATARTDTQQSADIAALREQVAGEQQARRQADGQHTQKLTELQNGISGAETALSQHQRAQSEVDKAQEARLRQLEAQETATPQQFQTAQQSAQQAQQSAQQAQQSATQASQTAQSAQSAAQNAVQTAQGAAQQAQTAAQTAQSANSTASQAQQTAQSANTTAQSAERKATEAGNAAQQATQTATAAQQAAQEATTAAQQALRQAQEAAAAAGAAQPTIIDARTNNRTPEWYWTNHPKKEVNEFKRASVVGLNNAGGEYVWLKTQVKWNDRTGGAIFQTAAADNGKRYIRQSTGNTTWAAWQELATVESVREQVATAAAQTGGSVNLVNHATTRANVMVSTSDGRENSLSGAVATDYIPVQAAADYALAVYPALTVSGYAVWYNANRGFISGQTLAHNTAYTVLTAPAGAVFLRLSALSRGNTAIFSLYKLS